MPLSRLVPQRVRFLIQAAGPGGTELESSSARAEQTPSCVVLPFLLIGGRFRAARTLCLYVYV